MVFIRSLSSVASEFSTEYLRQLPEPISTGWPPLDKIIGGLMPGLYVLGAISGLGKSTFALQMAEQIAERDKRPVLYFSLEMNSQAIAAKSLSRRIFQDSKGHVRLESNRLMRRWNQEIDPPPALQEAREKTEKNCGTLEIISPQEEPDPLTAEKITKIAENFLRKHPESPAPVVMVDYLQIIPAAPGDRDVRSIIDTSVQKLRGLTAHGMTVLLISSLNRSSYTKPIELSSFKESGGIEYSADVLLGLQFISVHSPERKDESWLQAEKGKPVREVEISVLKQRYGQSGTAIPFWYYAANDTFLSTDTGIDPEELAEEPGKGPVFKMNNTLISNLFRFPSNKLVWKEIPGGYQVEYIAHPMEKGRNDIETKLRLTSPRKDIPDYWHIMVADAVFTLYREKVGRFKVTDILRRLTGDRQKTMKKPRIDSKTKEMQGVAGDIARALDDMSKMEIEIDCKEEMALRWAKKNSISSTEGYPGQISFHGPFLRLERDGEYYKFLLGPGGGLRLCMPLYEYAQQEQMNQILTVPLPSLATPKDEQGKAKFSDTKETLMLKHYLARAVKLAAGSDIKTLSFTSAQGVFATLSMTPKKDASANSRKTLERLRRKYFFHTLDMLRYYIDELGILKGPRSFPENYKEKQYIRLFLTDGR